MTATMQQAIDLLQGFSEKEQSFALRILQQIPDRKINEDSYVCEFGYIHGDFNDETKAAIEETEEIIRQIKTGERQAMTLEEFFADLYSEDNDDV